MATLVLTAVGTAIGGPAGGAIGALIGSGIDQALFAPARRSGPRLQDLAVQSSAYGAPLPRLFGTVRVAGNVIWSSGLQETAHQSGGKRSGGRSTSYTYSASFAVAVSARQIAGIGRIWGDGKLLRQASGEITSEGALRIYTGGESQIPDPLIVAAEGASEAPAYRGAAYVLFENLQLADFANRIPNLTFEVIADPAPVSLAAILDDLCAAAGVDADADGPAATVPGFTAGRNSPLSDWVSALGSLTPVRIGERGGRLLFHDSAVETGVELDRQALVAGDAGGDTRVSARQVPDAVSLSYLDIARDYQPGLQRAWRIGGQSAQTAHLEVSAAMESGAAKAAAEGLLQRYWDQRVKRTRRLGIGQIGLAPGDRLTDDDGSRHEVRRASVEAMTVTLELEPVAPALAPAVPADPGRAAMEPDLPQGDTVLAAFELPPIGPILPTAPKLWLAAGGTGAGWRRAEYWISRDAGATWDSVGVASSAAAMGAAVAALSPGDTASWDLVSRFDVELLSDEMWLESRSRESVLAGANLALVGSELVQFTGAGALGDRRFRLSGLLRGRRATESAAAGHVAGERFVLLAPETLFPLDLPSEAIGATLLLKAVPPNRNFADAPVTTFSVGGEALRPLGPVHLKVQNLPNGDLAIGWTRRSRAGFAWIDGADAPLDEPFETYSLRISVGGAVHEIEVDMPEYLMPAALQQSVFGGLPATVQIEVAQVGAVTGAGTRTTGVFDLVR